MSLRFRMRRGAFSRLLVTHTRDKKYIFGFKAQVTNLIRFGFHAGKDHIYM